jgi:hypothetical protein
MAWYEVQELAMIPSVSDPSRMKCAAGFTTPEGALPVLLRALDTETACTCTQTTGTRPFQQGIAEQFVEVEVTRPDWPDFKLTVTFSLVNESWFTTVPASPETFDIQYDLHWTTQAPKISFQISNWNWTSPGNATSSLRLYFLETVSADEDTFLEVVEDRPFLYFTSNTTNAFFQTTYLSAFRAEGIDYVISAVAEPPAQYIIPKNQPQTVPFGLNLCHYNRPPNMTYSDLYYDPSIVALFTGDFASPSPETIPVSKNKPLNPAAYIVPIVLIALVLLVLVALTIFVPSFRQFFRPFSKPKTDGSRQTGPTRTTQGTTQNWARASTPAHP